ncbi:hypothetical protein RyT2_11780 [Pseudolactococcus yaeyamensis]
MMWTLRAMRVNVGLTQKEMAKVLGVSENTISNLERDSTNIRKKNFEKYADFFGVAEDDIFLGKKYSFSVNEQQAS